jgi:hypothetical protein
MGLCVSDGIGSSTTRFYEHLSSLISLGMGRPTDLGQGISSGVSWRSSPYTTGSENFCGEGLVFAKLGRSSSALKYFSMCGYCSFLFEACVSYAAVHSSLPSRDVSLV